MLFDVHIHHSLPVYQEYWKKRQQFTYQNNQIYCVSFYHFCYPYKNNFLHLTKTIQKFKLEFSANLITSQNQLSFDATKPKFILGIESMRPINELKQVEYLLSLGLRYFQPIHFWDNKFGNSNRLDTIPPSRQGMTKAGIELLQYLNDKNVVIDLAHMNLASMLDVLKYFKGKIMCSHTGIFSIAPHERNLRVEIARELIARGGLIGIIPWKRLITPKGGTITDLNSWLNYYRATIELLLKLGGQKNIAIGSDRGAPFPISPDFYSDKSLNYLYANLSDFNLDDFTHKNAYNFFSEALG